MRKAPTEPPAPANADVIKELDFALSVVMAERDQARTELAAVKAQIDGLLEGFEKGGSLGLLQQIGADRSWPIEVRVRALQAAVPFERPKLSMTATVNHRPLFDILEEARLKERKVIEAPPAQPKTVLGEGQGEHGAWHPLDSDKDDPAA
jgi:hypothetical protein